MARSDYRPRCTLMFVHCTNMSLPRPLTAPRRLRVCATARHIVRRPRAAWAPSDAAFSVGPTRASNTGEAMSQTVGETPRRPHSRRSRGSSAHRGADGSLAMAGGGPRRWHGRRHRRRTPGPARDGREGRRGADQEPRTAAEDRQARRLRRQAGPHQRRPQLRAVRAHLPRPARRRRRLRRRHRRRGPRAEHLGRPDQPDPARVDHPARPEGPGDHRRPPAGQQGPRRRGPPPGRLAGQDLAPRLGDRGQRPRPRPPVAPVRVRRRATPASSSPARSTSPPAPATRRTPAR